MSSRIRGRPDDDFSIEESDSDRTQKRGKKEHELKTDEVAQDVLSEEDQSIASKTIHTLKRERDDEAAPSRSKKAKDKTAEVQKRILPYRSNFPIETDLLVINIPDIATQNKIKKAADELFRNVPDKAVREEIITLTNDLSSEEKTAFLEHVGFYLNSNPKILQFLANIAPDQRVELITEFKELLFLIDDKNAEIQTIFSSVPSERLLESVLLVKSLLTNVSSHKDEEVIKSLLRAIRAIGKQNSVDLFNQLKPALQGITNGRVLAGTLNGILATVRKNSALSHAQLEQCIKDAKPFLHAVAEVFENKFESNIAKHVNDLFFILTQLPSDKRSELIERALYLSSASPNFVYAIRIGEKLLSLTTEQLDKAITQTKNFVRDLNVEHGKESGEILSAFILIEPDEYQDVVDKAKQLLKDVNSAYILRTLLIIGSLTPNIRERLIKEVESLAKFVDEYPSVRWEILNTLLKLPEDKVWSIRATIEPLLEGPVLTHKTLASIIEFAINEPQVDLFIKRCATFLGKFKDFSFAPDVMLKEISKIETDDWDNLLNQATPIIESLEMDVSSTDAAADILKAVAKIAPEEFDSISNHAKLLLEDFDYDGAEFADILTSINSVDPAERDFVVLSALADIDDETTINDIIQYLDDYGAYSLELSEQDIKEHPVELLAQLADQIAKKRANRVKVTYQGQKGQDAGGLARSFLSQLFEALPARLGLKARPNGLYTPIETDPLSDEKKKVYNDIGRVLMFCINAAADYPVGMIFELPVFTAIVRLNENHLKRPIQELVENQKTFDELCDIYLEMHRLDESQQNTLNWIRENKNSPDSRETIQGMMVDLFGPLIEIAKGMRRTSFTKSNSKDLQKMKPKELAELVQGKVDGNMVKQSLEFDDNVPKNLKGWIRKWIDNADEAKLSQFLVAMSGSPALGKMPLKISVCEGELTLFHTCFNHVELPVNILDTQEKLDTNLDANLGGGKFTMA